LSDYLFFPIAQQLLVDQGLLIIEGSQSHWASPNSVQILCTSVKRDTGKSTWQRTTLTREWYPCHRRYSNTQSQQRAVADPVSRPHCYGDRPCYENTGLNISLFIYKWNSPPISN